MGKMIKSILSIIIVTICARASQSKPSNDDLLKMFKEGDYVEIKNPNKFLKLDGKPINNTPINPEQRPKIIRVGKKNKYIVRVRYYTTKKIYNMNNIGFEHLKKISGDHDGKFKEEDRIKILRSNFKDYDSPVCPKRPKIAYFDEPNAAYVEYYTYEKKV